MDNSKIRLFTSANSWIESKAIIQLEAVASLEGVVNVIAMPDIPPGMNSVCIPIKQKSQNLKAINYLQRTVT